MLDLLYHKAFVFSIIIKKHYFRQVEFDLKILYNVSDKGGVYMEADILKTENSDTEEIRTADDKDVMEVSERLIEKNLEAYKELAK